MRSGEVVPRSVATTLVITVGTGKPTDDGRHLPLTVKRGDRILFGKHSGSEIKLDGEEYLILRERDVHAVASDRAGGQTGLYL